MKKKIIVPILLIIGWFVLAYMLDFPFKDMYKGIQYNIKADRALKESNYQVAIEYYRKYLDLVENDDIHYYLAKAYYGNKQYNSAIEHCDRAIEMGHKADSEFLELLEPYRKK